ncbi:hypothetical protein ACQY1Q_16970 [Tenacibaculum sp. TC6]|uniref:hypothetical protein n=1 Tax=Tenacibaculum sp. TC6 TaxID=3423223 RepID=UPI003D36FBA2
MKKILVILLLTYFGVSSQNKEDIVLISTHKKEETKNSIIFKINQENFRFNKTNFSKKNTYLNKHSYKILSIKELNNEIKIKLKNDKLQDKFISMYYDKYYNIFVFEKICKNYGTLYQVEWILKVDTKEID